MFLFLTLSNEMSSSSALSTYADLCHLLSRLDFCEAEVVSAREAHAALVSKRAPPPPLEQEDGAEPAGVATYVTCDIMDMPKYLAGVDAAKLCVFIHLIPRQVRNGACFVSGHQALLLTTTLPVCFCSLGCSH